MALLFFQLCKMQKGCSPVGDSPFFVAGREPARGGEQRPNGVFSHTAAS